MRQQVVITRGLPASGKSSWAIAQSRKPNTVRINRDALRAMYFPYARQLSTAQERTVTLAEEALAAAAIEAGDSVIIDAMHLRPKYVRRWIDFAERYGIDYVIEEFAITTEQAIAADLQRNEPVGEHMIRKIAARYYPNDTFLPLPKPRHEPPAAPYIAQPELPRAVLCDIDGTVALMGNRSPYAWDRVDEDRLNEPVAAALHALAQHCDRVVYLSGRDGSCAQRTQRWLRDQGLPAGELYLREAGDYRKDAIVKRELFDQHIRGRFNVWLVLDDRNQVVRMWRELGLTCLQVAEGNF